VHDTRASGEWDDSRAFYPLCEQIKRQLLPIADCIGFLVQNDFVRVSYKSIGEQEHPSKDELEHWRKYEQFTMDELDSLLYACSVRIVPKFKLYKAMELVSPMVLS
jgi:hypothetical protein